MTPLSAATLGLSSVIAGAHWMTDVITHPDALGVGALSLATIGGPLSIALGTGAIAYAHWASLKPSLIATRGWTRQVGYGVATAAVGAAVLYGSYRLQGDATLLQNDPANLARSVFETTVGNAGMWVGALQATLGTASIAMTGFLKSRYEQLAAR